MYLCLNTRYRGNTEVHDQAHQRLALRNQNRIIFLAVSIDFLFPLLNTG